MKKLVYADVFNEAWAAIKDDLALVIGLTLVILFGSGVLSMIPYIGYLLVAPLSFGYYRALLQIRQKKNLSYDDVFWGFVDFNRFLHAIVLNLIFAVGMGLGLSLLVVPGIWFLVAAMFAWPLFATTNPDGVVAIQKSMALVKGRWWNIAGFSFLSFLLLMAGSLFFGIGLLLTMPIVALAGLIAIEKLQQPQSQPTADPGPQPSAAAVTAEVVNSPS